MTISIGVLAGMGPRSTAPFIDLLMASCQKLYGASNDADFPLIHIISLPTPYYPGVEINESEMISTLTFGIDKLVYSGVDLIVIPYNLADCWFDKMQSCCGTIPILHIAETAINKLPPKAKKITLLATKQTIDNHFYQTQLKKAEFEFFINQDIQSCVTRLISEIKLKGYKSQDILRQWNHLISVIYTHNVDAVVIACTDISPLAAITNENSLPFIDAAECLSDAAVKEYMRLSKHY